MKIVYSDGFSADENNHYKSIVAQNLVTGIRKIIEIVEKRGLAFGDFNARGIRVLKEVISL